MNMVNMNWNTLGKNWMHLCNKVGECDEFKESG